MMRSSAKKSVWSPHWTGWLNGLPWKKRRGLRNVGLSRWGNLDIRLSLFLVFIIHVNCDCKPLQWTQQQCHPVDRLKPTSHWTQRVSVCFCFFVLPSPEKYQICFILDGMSNVSPSFFLNPFRKSRFYKRLTGSESLHSILQMGLIWRQSVVWICGWRCQVNSESKYKAPLL